MFNSVNELISFIESQRRNEKKKNLDYFKKLCSLFDNPQNKKQLIHIGGTNGKGSTISYIQNILMTAGYNVGTFISPYIICFNERITYNKNFISDEDVLRIGNYILSKYPRIEQLDLRYPSFFEFVTLMAFIYFSEIEALDYAIIEVGIGGLLDVTNIISPVAAAVTNVSYDHMNILGDTLGEIWDNKLGIMKADTPFFTIRDEEYVDKALNKAKEVGAPIKIINPKDIKHKVIDIHHTEFDYLDYHVKLRMLGAHQIENAILALELCMNTPGIKCTIDNVYQGLLNTFWPGRLEIVSNNPLIIIDGSHNIGGITALVNFIETVKKSQKVRLIFAVSSNKDKEAMIKMLEPHVEEIIFTHFMYKRSDESINLYNISHHKHKQIIDDIDTIIALTKAPNDFINIYCGSLYFISEIRNKF